jgi:hypothetical protein
MPVDITPLLPALFWVGVLVMGAWIVVMLPEAIASFRERAGAVPPMPGEDEPAAPGHAH